ncbi:MAG: DegT/DnrJ/EryC1/StrS family aminotransferase [Hyphomicrobiaceae bacterium]
MSTKSKTPQPALALIDLAAQQATIRGELDAAMKTVLDHGKYIMGPEVGAFESDLKSFCGASHAISCANGTDALLMVMMAKGIGPGDGVICPAFTFTATPEVIALLGATPVFADVSADTFNIDADGLLAAIDAATAAGLKPKAIIAVDLFGQPADYDRIEAFAKSHGLWVLSDSAQGFGGAIAGRKSGTFGLATTTSFFPAKPLGCYGDGGAIFTDDADLAEALESIRVHGKGKDKYDNVRIGLNARLDTLQAAILIEKLKIFPDEIIARNNVAKRYDEAFSPLNEVAVPRVPANMTSVWAQYTLRVAPDIRDDLAALLRDDGVPTAIYYPKPLHLQTAYRDFPVAKTGLAVSEQLSKQVISLPMHPYLAEADQQRVTKSLSLAMTNLSGRT